MTGRPLAALIFLFWASEAAGAPLKAVASFSILGDMVKNIGGEAIELHVIVGANGDAHVYEPRPADARAVAAADIVFINGLGFEGWMERVVEAASSRAPVVEASKSMPTIALGGEEPHEHEPGGEQEHAHEAVDPHGWQSLANAGVYVANITSGLCAADAKNCERYRANGRRYGDRLEALDREIRASIAKTPADRRRVISSHDAFGYFAKEYGITSLAPEGVSRQAEASAADVARLIGQIRAEQASALFVENITDRRLIEQIGRETGMEPGGELYSDALSEKEGPAPTYVDMMRHNARTIVEAIAAGS
jgi:zinc/manganese transport system substrate-binding protein